jgi:cytoskeletal protein CcmA (bactofilin family)
MYKPIIFLTIIMVLASIAGAAEYFGGETMVIREIDTLETDLFSGCRNLDVNGLVEGDIFAGCERITVEGEVKGDVITGCRVLTVTGVVGDNVIGFAQTIVIDGEVKGDVLAFGGVVRITDRAKIDGNVYVGAGELKFEGGTIGGYLRGGAGDANLEGRVEGDVELEVGDIYFGPDYFAKGGTTLKRHKEIEKYELAHTPKDLEVIVKHEDIFLATGFFFWSLFALLIVGMVIVALFKNFSKDYLTFARTQLGKSIGYGVLLLLLTPIAIVILAVLILTIPISLILLAVYLVLIYLSMAFSALYIGDYIMAFFRKEPKNNGLFISMLVGVVLVSLLCHVPFIGGLFGFIIICFGMGSLINYIWHLKQDSTKG